MEIGGGGGGIKPFQNKISDLFIYLVVGLE